MTQTQESAGPKPLVIAKATPPQIIKTTSNVEPMVLDDPHNLDLIISYDVINEEVSDF
jgi:hypothetical protein